MRNCIIATTTIIAAIMALVAAVLFVNGRFHPAAAFERCSWQNRDGRIVLVCCDTETGRCRVTQSR